MKKHYNRLRQVRPCYVCARKGRHYLETENPVLCLACSKMPSDWRNELKEKHKVKFLYQKYLQKYLDKVNGKNKKTNKEIRFSIEPICLPNYVDGGYPMVYYISGDAICGKCIHSTLQTCYISERVEICRGLLMEGPAEICTECNCVIESAYGEVKDEH